MSATDILHSQTSFVCLYQKGSSTRQRDQQVEMLERNSSDFRKVIKKIMNALSISIRSSEYTKISVDAISILSSVLSTRLWLRELK